jgi:TolA-binding protein
MRWLLRLISPRAWQRDQFQQLQYQITQLSVQIENLQYQLMQSYQALETHIDEKLKRED